MPHIKLLSDINFAGVKSEALPARQIEVVKSEEEQLVNLLMNFVKQ